MERKCMESKDNLGEYSVKIRTQTSLNYLFNLFNLLKFFKPFFTIQDFLVSILMYKIPCTKLINRQFLYKFNIKRLEKNTSLNKNFKLVISS